jgi:hypothetical protein
MPIVLRYWQHTRGIPTEGQCIPRVAAFISRDSLERPAESPSRKISRSPSIPMAAVGANPILHPEPPPIDALGRLKNRISPGCGVPRGWFIGASRHRTRVLIVYGVGRLPSGRPDDRRQTWGHLDPFRRRCSLVAADCFDKAVRVGNVEQVI